jgi:PAS domain S-box-containing protein
MAGESSRETELLSELEDLRSRLGEAEETLRAIRGGEVDALVVAGTEGDQIFTLKGADHSYRVFLEQMHEGAATLTTDHVILYCNRRFAELLAMPLEEVVGSSVDRFVRAGDRPALAAILREGVEEAGGKGEISFSSREGLVPVYLAVSALPWDEDLEALCLVVTDLTEQKRNEQLFADERLARSVAEAANQAKDRFLATLSHELRTPLTPVLAVVSGLQEDERLPEDVRVNLAMMRRNIELEARLIDDMLDLTRITRGKLPLHREISDLRQVLDDSLQTVMKDFVDKGLRLAMDLADADHRVWADTPRLTQVFWNLFSNAVKFTPEDGAITVRSHREESPQGPRLVVTISDTGIGIESDVLETIFDAFQQGEKTITRRFGGLGLGLAISKAIIELHGGDLSAESSGKGHGATFSVRLPAGDLPAAAPPSPVGAAAAGALEGGPVVNGAFHILLVEDHIDTAEAMADLLRAMGHEITVAGTVAAGLAAAERLAGRLDLVVSDLGLPDGSGLDLMQQLTGRYSVRGIALSGYGMEEDVRRSLDAGFERHLTKPINLQALQAAIQETLRREL